MPPLERACPKLARKYPAAYHVLPLHSAKPVYKEGSLLSKSELATRGIALRRPTTQEVDKALGFADYIHFYLPRANMGWSALSILAAQLQASSIPPFPHVVLMVPSGQLDLESCVVCNWNIAVSRPAVPKVHKGGNWARGTSATRIAKGWRDFRDWLMKLDETADRKLRRARGIWQDGFLVPVLRGGDLAENAELVGCGAASPELLWRSPFRIPLDGRFVAFSREDELTLSGMGVPADRITLEVYPGYSGSLVDPNVRRVIKRYCESDSPLPVDLDYDRIRPKV